MRAAHGRVAETKSTRISLSGMSKKFNVGNVFKEKKFDVCESLSVKFDIFRKIVDRETFFDTH